MGDLGKGGGGGGGGSQFVPTQTGTAYAPQQAMWDKMFSRMSGLPSAPLSPNTDFLTRGAEQFRDIQGGGYRGALEQAALNQMVNPINSAAVQAGRYGSLPQQAALQNAGIMARQAAMQPEMQAMQMAPQMATALSPEYQSYAGQVADIGNLKNLASGMFGTQTTAVTPKAPTQRGKGSRTQGPSRAPQPSIGDDAEGFDYTSGAGPNQYGGGKR